MCRTPTAWAGECAGKLGAMSQHRASRTARVTRAARSRAARVSDAAADAGVAAPDGCDERDPRWPFPPLMDLRDWERLYLRIGLTPREAEVVWCVSRGLRSAQVCWRLRVKAPTIKTLLRRAYLKLGCADRVELVLTLVHLRDGSARACHPAG